MRLAGVVDAEVDLREGEAERGRRGGDGAGGVQNQLPLAVREEDADGDVGAEQGDGEDAAEGFEYPGRIDEVDHLGWGGAALRIVAGCLAGVLFGAGVGGHGSFATSPASHAVSVW